MSNSNKNVENESLKLTDISAVTVNATELGKIIGVTERRVRQLAEEGILIRAAKGRYVLTDSLKAYILKLKISMESKGEDPDVEISIDEEKAIHEKVKRQMSELKLKIMQGELHKSEDVKNVMTDMLMSVKTKLLAMPSKLAPMLVSRNDIGFVKDALNCEVIETLNELKEYNPKDFYSEEYVDLEENDDEKE